MNVCVDALKACSLDLVPHVYKEDSQVVTQNDRTEFGINGESGGLVRRPVNINKCAVEGSRSLKSRNVISRFRRICHVV